MNTEVQCGKHGQFISGWRSRLGFMVVSTDTTVESDTYRMVPYGVSVHFDRIYLADVTSESLAKMIEGVESSARLLSDAKPDAIAFACTSASVVIGAEAIITEILKVSPGVYATTIITAVIHALETLDLKRISLVTPYVDDVNRIEAEYLEVNGFQIMNIHGMGITEDMQIASVPPDKIYRFVKDAVNASSDGVFISCGNFRSAAIIDVLERDLRKPVITSNQAMVWDMLRHLNITDPIPAYGKLMQNH